MLILFDWPASLTMRVIMTSNAEIKIEPARAKDVPLIFEFVREIAQYEKLSDTVKTSEEKITSALFGPQPCAEAIIAYSEVEPIGFALFYFNYSSFTGLPGLYLEDIFVRPSSRDAGVGLQIFRYLATRAQERGCGRIEWSVLDWNEGAIRFYRRLAAEPVQDWTVFRLGPDQINQLASNRGNSPVS